MTDATFVEPLCETPGCPGRYGLRCFAIGELPEDEIEHVANCSSVCQRCQEELSSLDSEVDTLIARLRKAASSTADDLPDHLNLLMGQAERLGPAFAGDAASPSQAEANDPPDIPARLGQYRILERLGSGGMGAVYRAEHVMLQKPVALKVLLSLRAGDRESIDRFIREMKAVGQVEHPNITRATDAGEDAGRHFLVMELVEGIDVAELLARCGPLPIADACEIIRQAAMGLAHVHELGIVHRDVKPSNLMVSYLGQVKVQDLGLAKVLADQTSDALTGSEQILGTLDYIAPEQVVPSGPIDGRADVYGLGCTLYALLTGSPPFGGTEFDSPVRKIAAHAQREAPSINDRRADVPPALAAIVAKMLNKSPADRMSTAHEVAEAMTPFAEGSDLPALVRSATGGESTVDLALKPPTEPATCSSMAESRGSTPLRRAIVAIFAAAALAGIVALVVRPAADRGSSIVNAGATLNTESFDGNPRLSSDGLRLYFDSTRAGGQGGRDIYLAERSSLDEGFSAPINLGSAINDRRHTFGMLESTDGLSLIYSVDGSLQMATRPSIATPWNNSVVAISDAEFDEINASGNASHPTISTDRLTLIFQRDFHPGIELMMSTRAAPTDPWSPPDLLVNLNSPVFDGHPFLSEDGLSLWFGSDRSGNTDIYRAVRDSPATPWTDPRLVAEPVTALNSRSHDSSPCIVGEAMFFQSNRPGGIGNTDLYTTSWRARRSAPPVQPIFETDWTKPFFTENETTTRFHKNGHRYIRLKPGKPGWYGANIRRCRECIVEVVGRVADQSQGGVLVNFAHRDPQSEKKTGVCVVVDYDRGVWVHPSLFPTDKKDGPRFEFKHDAIKPAGSWNRLQFVVRKRSLEIRVNGTRVCEPVECDSDLTPFTLAVGIAGIDNKHGATIELASVKVWDTTDLRRIAGQGELPGGDAR